MVEWRYYEKTPITRRKPATLSTKNPVLTGHGSKRGHRGERPAVLMHKISNSDLIQISSPYRAVNTLRLGYTNQSVNAA
jgi:hypothetical protein